MSGTVALCLFERGDSSIRHTHEWRSAGAMSGVTRKVMLSPQSLPLPRDGYATTMALLSTTRDTRYNVDQLRDASAVQYCCHVGTVTASCRQLACRLRLLRER